MHDIHTNIRHIDKCWQWLAWNTTGVIWFRPRHNRHNRWEYHTNKHLGWKSWISQADDVSYLHQSSDHPFWQTQWASVQICKLRVVDAPECWKLFPPPPRVSDPDMHHGARAVMHARIANQPFPLKLEAGKTFPTFPAQPAILRIWQEAHVVPTVLIKDEVDATVRQVRSYTPLEII